MGSTQYLLKQQLQLKSRKSRFFCSDWSPPLPCSDLEGRRLENELFYPASVPLWKKQWHTLVAHGITADTPLSLLLWKEVGGMRGRWPQAFQDKWEALMEPQWVCFGIQTLGPVQGFKFIWTNEKETMDRLLLLGMVHFCPLKKKNPTQEDFYIYGWDLWSLMSLFLNCSPPLPPGPQLSHLQVEFPSVLHTPEL